MLLQKFKIKPLDNDVLKTFMLGDNLMQSKVLILHSNSDFPSLDSRVVDPQSDVAGVVVGPEHVVNVEDDRFAAGDAPVAHPQALVGDLKGNR